MSSRMITISGFVLLFVLAAALVVIAWVRRDRLATFSEVIAHAGRRRVVRIGVLLIWAWLGWHFLAR